jgi:ATP/maltotriose-dependent transcriptional regulator MalT
VLALAHLTHMEKLAGRARPDAMAMVVTRAEAHGAPLLGGSPRAWLAKQLLWDGQLDASRQLVNALLTEGARSSHELERPYRLYDLALVELTAGHLPEAQALRTGLMAAADAGNRDAEGWLYYPQAWWHALAGRTDEARECAGRLLSETGRPAGLPAQARARRVLGTLALAEGNPAVAAEELGEAAAVLRRWGVTHPGAIPVLPDAIEASAGAGDLGAAGRLLTELEDQVERTGTAWSSAMLRRSRAVVALARGEADAAAGELLSAAATLAELGHEIEAARARLLAGQALLRASRRSSAAEVLTKAYEAFGELGAVLWEDRARAEVERAAAGRTTGILTPTEREVVRLVTAGRRNREVAAEMFLGLATVEAHLTRTYRKLGVRSRSELVGLVGRGDLDLDVVPAGRA